MNTNKPVVITSLAAVCVIALLVTFGFNYPVESQQAVLIPGVGGRVAISNAIDKSFGTLSDAEVIIWDAASGMWTNGVMTAVATNALLPANNLSDLDDVGTAQTNLVFSNAVVVAQGSTAGRSLGTRFKDAINVRDYGAVGDGITDDTVAFQTALTNETVFVPGGTYIIDGELTLNLTNNSQLIGRGAAVLKLKATTNGVHTLLRIASVTNVLVSGLTLLGETNTPIGGASGVGLSIRNSRSVTIRDVAFNEWFSYGCYIGGSGGSSDVLLDRITCSHNRRNGLAIVHATNVMVVASTFEYSVGESPEAGVDIEPNSGGVVRDVRFTACRFAHNGLRGIYLNKGAGDAVERIRIDDTCIAEGHTNVNGAGISLSLANDCLLAGQSRSNYFGVAISSSTNTIYRGLAENNSYGVYLFDSDTVSITGSSLVRNNVPIYNSSSSSTNVWVADNIFSGNTSGISGTNISYGGGNLGLSITAFAIGVSSAETELHIGKAGVPALTLQRTDAGVGANDELGRIDFRSTDSQLSTTNRVHARISSYAPSGVASDVPWGALRFAVGGQTLLTDEMWLTDTGLGLGTNDPQTKLHVNGTSTFNGPVSLYGTTNYLTGIYVTNTVSWAATASINWLSNQVQWLSLEGDTALIDTNRTAHAGIQGLSAFVYNPQSTNCVVTPDANWKIMSTNSTFTVSSGNFARVNLMLIGGTSSTNVFCEYIQYGE